MNKVIDLILEYAPCFEYTLECRASTSVAYKMEHRALGQAIMQGDRQHIEEALNMPSYYRVPFMNVIYCLQLPHDEKELILEAFWGSLDD